jgi:DNA-binding IscR family transcriptional regulator
MPSEISAYQVLTAVESSLMEKAEPTVEQKAPEIDAAMQSLVFDALDGAARASLGKVTLDDLVHEAEKHHNGQGFMFFI